MPEHPLVDLGSVAMRILEDAAFIFTEPIEEETAPDFPLIRAGLSFNGPQSGWVTIAASPEFAVLLAANLLGVEPDEPDAMELRHGAVGEILNMIAGSLMEQIFGNQVVVHLGIPEVATVEREALDALPADQLVALLTEEEYRLDLALQWND